MSRLKKTNRLVAIFSALVCCIGCGKSTNLTIDVDADGQMQFCGNKVEAVDVRGKMIGYYLHDKESIGRDVPIRVKGNTPWHYVNDAARSCNSAGYGKINIAVTDEGITSMYPLNPSWSMMISSGAKRDVFPTNIIVTTVSETGYTIQYNTGQQSEKTNSTFEDIENTILAIKIIRHYKGMAISYTPSAGSRDVCRLLSLCHSNNLWDIIISDKLPDVSWEYDKRIYRMTNH